MKRESQEMFSLLINRTVRKHHESEDSERIIKKLRNISRNQLVV